MDLLARMRTLVRVVEVGSLSAAARSSKLSLAAVSRQVKSLESELGVSLLARTTRSVRLTEEGRRFFEHASRLVRDADAAFASVRPDGAVGGRVVVSASVTLGLLRIMPSLAKLLAAHPRLDLELRLEDRATDLVGEGVDIAVRAGLSLPDTTSLVAQPLARFERFVVASPAYLRREGTPRGVASLATHHAVLGLESRGQWTFKEEGEPRSVEITPKLRVGTLLGIRDGVIAGIGLATLPDFVVADALASGALRRVLPRAELNAVSAHALHRVEQRGTPRIDAVLTHLRANLPLSASPAADAG